MVVGLNPGAVYWMNISDRFVVPNCIVCLKRPKINEKEAGFGPLKKYSIFHILCSERYALHGGHNLVQCDDNRRNGKVNKASGN